MPWFRVEIAFWEPSYARHSGRPPRIYRFAEEVAAVSPSVAEERAVATFRDTERASAVGWSRRIVKVTVRLVDDTSAAGG